MTLSEGKRLDPHEIVTPHGADGMGKVCRGSNSRLDRELAIQVLPSHLITNRALNRRLDLETKAISKLSHLAKLLSRP